MNVETLEFTVLNTHEDTINSSINGDMTERLQLCQNNENKEHFYTYEALDSKGDIIGGRLFYFLKNPNQALDEWDAFISTGLNPSIEATVIKQEIVLISRGY